MVEPPEDEAETGSVCWSARLPAVRCCRPGSRQWSRACELQGHDCACCSPRPIDFLEAAPGRLSGYVDDSPANSLHIGEFSPVRARFLGRGAHYYDLRSRLSADKVEATELVRAGIRLQLF